MIKYIQDHAGYAQTKNPPIGRNTKSRYAAARIRGAWATASGEAKMERRAARASVAPAKTFKNRSIGMVSGLLAHASLIANWTTSRTNRAPAPGMVSTLSTQRSPLTAPASPLGWVRANATATAMVEAAQKSVSDELLQARNALRREAIDLAVDFAEQQLKAQLTDSQQGVLVEQVLNRVERDGATQEATGE